ncbi:MAG TPA: hypothetical protein VJQ57_02455 [Acidimicrobiia bacterium]|nr:hypothetical protein [Acidimicrobiia bacterium]
MSEFGEASAIRINCPNCGVFEISRSLRKAIYEQLPDRLTRALVSWVIHRGGGTESRPYILNTDVVSRIRATQRLPSVMEKCNLALEALEAAQNHPGESVALEYSHWRARTAALDPDEVQFIFKSLEDQDLVTGDIQDAIARLRLSLRGWVALEEMRRSGVRTRRAMYAMPFGNDLLDRVLKEVFRPACRRTGFQPYRLDDEPKAGLIDNRLRVSIRTARFLLVELTLSNAGAYWEAGFAEGLGKPVIYTCDKRFFDKSPPYEDRKGVHFDVNHHQHVLWHPDQLKAAEDALVATIRATLPGEAKLDDEEESES